MIESIVADSPKTRQFAKKMKGLGLDGTVLVVTDRLDENVFLASRNLPDVLVLEAREVDPVSLVRFQQRAAHEGGDRPVRGDARMNAPRPARRRRSTRRSA